MVTPWNVHPMRKGHAQDAMNQENRSPQFQIPRTAVLALFTVILRTVNCWFPTNMPYLPPLNTMSKIAIEHATVETYAKAYHP